MELNLLAQFTIYYGVKVSPTIQAGTYSTEVTYTATAILPPPPELSTITPSTFYLTSGHDGTVRITISNSSTNTDLTNILDYISAIYVDLNGNGQLDMDNSQDSTYPSSELCRDLTLDPADTSNHTLICTMPTDTYLQYLGKTDLLANLTTTNNGTYPIRMIYLGGDIDTNQTYSYHNPSGQIPTSSTTSLPSNTNRTMSICQNGTDSSDCQVDIDSNMIPIKYIGTHSNPAWAVVTSSEQTNNTGLWYNYSVELPKRH